MYGTNDTKLVLETASPNLFIFTVAAINILGTGEESDITSEFVGGSLLSCVYTKSQLTTLITINFTT